MKTIKEYLDDIFKDFKKDIENAKSLCDLQSLTYKNGNLPVYSNKKVQQLYLLRYAYGYSYEYKEIYKEVLRRMGEQEQLSVVSVGCGSMIDYWSLIQALSAEQQSDSVVNYVGIDKADWKYRFSNRKQDNMRYFFNSNAVTRFANNPKFVSDIYFFPKSISEFSEKEIQQIAACFEKKPIEKDRFFICVSLRNSDEKRSLDMAKTKILTESIERNGFDADGEEDTYYYYSENQPISTLDTSYHYPEEIIRYMNSLDEKCRHNSCKDSSYGYACCSNFNRNPILRTGEICYQIIEFRRSEAA